MKILEQQENEEKGSMKNKMINKSLILFVLTLFNIITL